MSLVAAAFVLPSQLASADLDFEQISIGACKCLWSYGLGFDSGGVDFFFYRKIFIFYFVSYMRGVVNYYHRFCINAMFQKLCHLFHLQIQWDGWFALSSFFYLH